jgi:hypothetical protein
MPERTPKTPGKPVAIYLDVANAVFTKKAQVGMSDTVDPKEINTSIEFGQILARERQKWEAEARLEKTKRLLEQAAECTQQLAEASARLEEPEPGSPPHNASYLLRLLLNANDRQAIPGDLEEEYWTEILPRDGERRARFWFWTQTVQAIATRNPICKWLLVGTIFRATAWIWRMIGG